MRIARAGGLATLIVCTSLLVPRGPVVTQTIGSGGVSSAMQIDTETDYYAFVETLEHLQPTLATHFSSGDSIHSIDFSSPGAAMGGHQTYIGKIVLDSPMPGGDSEIRCIYVHTGQTVIPQCPPDRLKTFVRNSPFPVGGQAQIPSGPTFDYLLQVLQSPPAEVLDLLALHELTKVSATLTNNPPTGYVAELEYSSGPLSLPITLTVECMAGQPGLGNCTSWNVTIH